MPSNVGIKIFAQYLGCLLIHAYRYTWPTNVYEEMGLFIYICIRICQQRFQDWRKYWYNIIIRMQPTLCLSIWHWHASVSVYWNSTVVLAQSEHMCDIIPRGICINASEHIFDWSNQNKKNTTFLFINVTDLNIWWKSVSMYSNFVALKEKKNLQPPYFLVFALVISVGGKSVCMHRLPGKLVHRFPIV